MVAAVDQVQAIALAGFFRRLLRMQHHERIGAVRGGPGIRRVHKFSRGHRHIHPLHFPRPRAPETGDDQVRPVHVQLRGKEPFHLYGLLRFVDQPASPGDHVARLKHRVGQLQRQAVFLVLQSDQQAFGPVVIVRGRQAIPLRQIFHHLRFFKAKVRGEAPVRVHHLQKRFPDVALAVGGELQTHVLQGHRGMLRIERNQVSGRERPLFRERLGLLHRQPPAVVQVLQMPRLRYAKRIRRVLRIKKIKRFIDRDHTHNPPVFPSLSYHGFFAFTRTLCHADRVVS